MKLITNFGNKIVKCHTEAVRPTGIEYGFIL